MVDHSELSAYAHELGELLCQVYGGTLSDRFARVFVSESLRLRPSDHEDLGGLVFLECHDHVSKGGELTDKSLERIVHRIRQRLARHARREIQVDPALLDQHGSRPSRESLTAVSEPALRRLVDALSPDEALVLHLSAFEGRAPRDIASTLGVSLATVYRRLNAAREHLRRLIS